MMDGAFCVNIRYFAFTSSGLLRQLCCHTKRESQLGLPTSKLSKNFSERLRFNPYNQKQVQRIASRRNFLDERSFVQDFKSSDEASFLDFSSCFLDFFNLGFSDPFDFDGYFLVVINTLAQVQNPTSLSSLMSVALNPLCLSMSMWANVLIAVYSLSWTCIYWL